MVPPKAGSLWQLPTLCCRCAILEPVKVPRIFTRSILRHLPTRYSEMISNRRYEPYLLPLRCRAFVRVLLARLHAFSFSRGARLPDCRARYARGDYSCGASCRGNRSRQLRSAGAVESSSEGGRCDPEQALPPCNHFFRHHAAFVSKLAYVRG